MAGMKVCLSGLLENTKGSITKGHKYMLAELYKHLEMVREDPSRLQEFFDLYV